MKHANSDLGSQPTDRRDRADNPAGNERIAFHNAQIDKAAPYNHEESQEARKTTSDAGKP